ncbi:hypothetical protein [Stenotrophomonas pigmentata]|uniref:hypothetical protein n=1 Tax=Stenotrophomonas pigmentata TaxID=3055080 RepID=UPI0026F06DF8|nr:hypothetical protein [Stenotrophomonas sp. 610A2]
MNTSAPSQLVIEIDEEVAVLIAEINASPGVSRSDFADNLKDVVIDSVLGPFGLSRSMFSDKDGGSITTAHNFEEALADGKEHLIALRDAERLQSLKESRENRIDRSAGNKQQGIAPGKHHAYDQALEQAMPLKSATPDTKDAYTGRDMKTPSRDHVIPVGEIERSAKGQLAQTPEERVQTATLKENLVWTEKSLNSSKQDSDLMLWATAETAPLAGTNDRRYGIDMEKAQEIYETSKKAVERKQNLAMLKKQSKEFLIEGGSEAGKLALRQILGMILKDLASGLIDDVKQLVRDGFQSLKQLAELLKARLLATASTLKEKWADFLKEGGMAGFAGLLSNLITLLINSFVTTAKRIVTIIRESTLAVIRSIKLIALPPEGMSGSDIAMEVLKLLSGGLVTAATLLLQESVAKAIESIPLLTPFAQDISSVLVAILSGTMGLLTVLAFDRLKEHIAFQNKQLADVHRGHAVAHLKMKQTLMMFDHSYAHVVATTTQMQLELSSTWMEIEESSQHAHVAIDGYASAVDKLRLLAKRAP